MDLFSYLKTAISAGASDLHITPDSPPMLRLDGDLTPIENEPVLDKEMTHKLISSVMTDAEKKSFDQELELDFTVNLPDASASFRANAFHQANGEGGVFRTIPSQIPTLESLGIPESIRKLLDLPNGLILLTGPTGSGKSTTLAAMINYLNTNYPYHVITIEDPIEFKHKRTKCIINQRQVNRDTKSFENALRAALREDPDVILVGEMRDLETMRLALTAAETGHLVLGTLHTSSAPRAVSRIIDIFPSGEKNIIRNLLSESFQAVICQALVKKIGGGRAAAYEIMLGTPAIRNLIREDKVAQMYSTIQMSSQLGMITMQQSLQNLVKDKIISLETAIENGYHPDA